MDTDDILRGKLRGDSITLPPVGKCIYCGASSNLTDEHIVPYSLNGNTVLPKSSCKRCAKITSKFERHVARHMFGVFRIKRDYQTNRPKDRPTHLPIDYVTREGERKSKLLAVEDYPETYLVPWYAKPGILTGASPSDGNPGMSVATVMNHDEMERAELAIGEQGISILCSHTFEWGPFSLTLAKIAHAFVVAAVGTEGYIPLLPDLIRGEAGFLSHYVGGYGTAGTESAGGPIFLRHHLSIQCVPIGDFPNIESYLVVHIALVGGASMPTYQVVAGKITDFLMILKARENPAFKAFNP